VEAVAAGEKTAGALRLELQATLQVSRNCTRSCAMIRSLPRAARAAALALALSGLAAVPVRAQGPAVSLELNRAEEVEGACRLYLVVGNGLDVPLDPFTLDMVAFDSDGVIASRLAVDLAPVPPGKTQVRLFDVAGPGCGSLSALLLNEVVACGAGEATGRDCLPLLAVSTRSAIDFRL
jgi:hypothetical protein